MLRCLSLSKLKHVQILALLVWAEMSDRFRLSALKTTVQALVYNDS